MKTKLYTVSGCLYAAITVLISRCILRYLDIIWGWLHLLFHLTDPLADHITLVLLQFRSADILSPWLPFIVLGGLIGYAASRKKKHQGLFISILYIVLWIPLLLLILWFTTMNDIRLGALLQSALSLFL